MLLRLQLISHLVMVWSQIQAPTTSVATTEDLLVQALKENTYRTLVVVTNSSDVALPPNLPKLLVTPEGIKRFNGPYHTSFNYGAIAEESRMYLLVTTNQIFTNVVDTARRIYFFRARQNMLVVYLDVPGDPDLIKHFQICWKHHMLNVVFLVGGRLLTFDPFAKTYLVEVHGRVFQEKSRDLMGFNIRMSVFPTPLDAIPYGGDYVGRDASLMKTLARDLNATYSYVPPRDGITYGLRFKNGSMSGVFADVVDGISDLTLNSRLVKLQFENVLEGAYPHDWEDLVAVVPKSQRAPEYEKFTGPFPPHIWMLFGAGMLGFAVGWWKIGTTIGERSDPPGVILDAYTLALGNPIRDPTNIQLRLLLLFYSGYLFFLLNAYKGLLTSVLTVPIGLPEINTLEQLERSGLDIYAATRFKDMLQDNIGAGLTPGLVAKIIPVPDDPDVDRVIKKQGRYAVILKMTFALRALLDASNYKNGVLIYRMMKERPMPAQVCYAVRYGSPLLPRINQLLRRFQESGLNDQWKSASIRWLVLKNRVSEDAGTSLRVLTMENLSVAFYGLGIGLAASLVTFTIELLTHKIKKH